MIKKYLFLFEELVKRDFVQKYKRTFLGVGWSILSPLLTLAIMSLVFTRFFGKSTPHYTIYLFCGILVMSFFRESTTGGMGALVTNRKIISSIKVPKIIFVLSKNTSVLINFLINLGIFFIFCIFDDISFSVKMLLLVYPIVFLTLFNIGTGLILSAFYAFFKDIEYIYGAFLVLLNYLSAIFYNVESFGKMANLFYLNPVYCYIAYFRTIVIEGNVPSLLLHVLCLMYALVAMALGLRIYHKNENRFLYYM